MAYTRIEIDRMPKYCGDVDEELVSKHLSKYKDCLGCNASVLGYKYYGDANYITAVSLYCRFYERWVSHQDNCKKIRKQIKEQIRWQNKPKEQKHNVKGLTQLG